MAQSGPWHCGIRVVRYRVLEGLFYSGRGHCHCLCEWKKKKEPPENTFDFSTIFHPPSFSIFYLRLSHLCKKKKKVRFFWSFSGFSIFATPYPRKEKKIFSTEEEGRYFFLFFLKIYLCSRPFCSEWIFFSLSVLHPSGGVGSAAALHAKPFQSIFPKRDRSCLLSALQCVRAYTQFKASCMRERERPVVWH